MFITCPIQQKGAHWLRSRTQQSGRGLRLHNLPSSNTGYYQCLALLQTKSGSLPVFRLSKCIYITACTTSWNPHVCLWPGNGRKRRNRLRLRPSTQKTFTFAFPSDLGPQILGSCLIETQSLWILKTHRSLIATQLQWNQRIAVL
jgi:hypothetical protein